MHFKKNSLTWHFVPSLSKRRRKVSIKNIQIMTSFSTWLVMICPPLPPERHCPGMFQLRCYTWLPSWKKKQHWSMRVCVNSSRGLEMRCTVSREVISGRSSVGHQQMARFLLSMQVSCVCSLTLQRHTHTHTCLSHALRRYHCNMEGLWLNLNPRNNCFSRFLNNTHLYTKFQFYHRWFLSQIY